MSSADWLLVSWWCQWSRDSFSATPCDMTRNKPSECWHKKCTYITQVHIKSTSREHISAPLVDPYCHKTGFDTSDYVMMTSWCCNVSTFMWHFVCVTNFAILVTFYSYRQNDSNLVVANDRLVIGNFWVQKTAVFNKVVIKTAVKVLTAPTVPKRTILVTITRFHVKNNSMGFRYHYYIMNSVEFPRCSKNSRGTPSSKSGFRLIPHLSKKFSWKLLWM